eukprot:CAMPEP_0184486900 /NCGR_PEP_ID=MMETSP0113_2-20130426/8780_1 /TAXON_ID=91329 /ORGANISM="Norrisiella sphaerica, Strain BC52" /LENGTH=460 /DNA_ID=CAMNT_0026868979 /DNA_START=87 /DNA_END=1469 /DNA_ORIENTATION=+
MKEGKRKFPRKTKIMLKDSRGLYKGTRQSQRSSSALYSSDTSDNEWSSTSPRDTNVFTSKKFLSEESVVTDFKNLSLKDRIKDYCLNPVPQSFDKPAVPGFVFDIDGVFKNGGKYASYGAKALRLLKEAGLPYVFMTNGGGGRTERQYADVMNQKLSAFDSEKLGKIKYVQEDQMILSYTPFATHLSHLKDEPVLIVGCPRAKNAAKSYGFRKPMAISEYTRKHPTMNPFGKAGCEKDNKVIINGKEQWDEGIKAILVFTDPGDFFEAIQVLTDILLSSRPGEKEYEKYHRIPVVFSNPDLLWKTQYPHARFGQGAFRLSLEACYKARMQAMGLSDIEIKQRLDDFVQFGKPEHAQFYHAREAALNTAKRLGCSISHFYMVGDNPRSDITGAVEMDKVSISKKLRNWSGMLVRTGVWQDGDNTMGAKGIYNNVVDVIKHILKKHANEIQELSDGLKHAEA